MGPEISNGLILFVGEKKTFRIGLDRELYELTKSQSNVGVV